MSQQRWTKTPYVKKESVNVTSMYTHEYSPSRAHSPDFRNGIPHCHHLVKSLDLIQVKFPGHPQDNSFGPGVTRLNILFAE
eukprot:1331640-Amorphochlora_amoeboformis.AAC.1